MNPSSSKTMLRYATDMGSLCRYCKMDGRRRYSFLYNLAGCSEAVVIDKDIEVIDNFGIKVRLVYSGWSQGIVIPYAEEVE